MSQQNPSWKSIYISAIAEPDQRQLPSRVADAKRVLTEHLRQLHLCGGGRAERERIEHALRMLDLLMRTRRAA